jgi:microcystin-dependent protein
MEPFLGEIRCFVFGLIPRGGLLATASRLISLKIRHSTRSSQTFSGATRTAFNLPNLNGVAPTQIAVGAVVGANGGAETVTLGPLLGNMPTHNHFVSVSTTVASQRKPADNYLAATAAPDRTYAPATDTTVAMAPRNVGNAGTGHAHSNMQPYLAINFCISTSGYYPPRS